MGDVFGKVIGSTWDLPSESWVTNIITDVVGGQMDIRVLRLKPDGWICEHF